VILDIEHTSQPHPTTYHNDRLLSLDPDMAESFNKKRKAQVSELTLEDDHRATQHSRLPSSRTSASHNPLADRTCTRRKTTKRQKVAQAKSDLSLGRESNALTFTDAPTNTSAADEGDIVTEDTPVQDLIALSKGARAKRTKAKKRVVEEAEDEDDDVKVQERLRARLTSKRYLCPLCEQL
jgi:hypothetical protein